MSSFPVLAASERVSTSADSAGFRRPSLHRGPPPLEWGRAERAEQGGAGLRARPSPRSPCLRPRRLALNSAPGTGSEVAAPRRPLSFLQPLRSSAGRAASSWGLPVVPTVPLAASAVVWTPHTRVPSPWVTTGRGRRARRSPNARLQSFLGSAVGSAKCLRQRPGPSGEGPGETRAWRGLESQKSL